MYQVIEMYGDYEPWWFLEDWEKDIVTSQSFDDYYEALKYYKRQWLLLREQSPLFKSRSDLMTIFWDPEDQRWCEECAEYVQQYHSVAYWKTIRRFQEASVVQVTKKRMPTRLIAHVS